MEISHSCLDLLKRFEGCRLAAYRDGAGIPTIGYGHTMGVKHGDICTQEQADLWLLKDTTEACRCVLMNIRTPISQNQLDALVSFVFNVGCRNFKYSTLLRLINVNDFTGAAEEFLKWDFVDHNPSAGLLARREAERNMFVS